LNFSPAALSTVLILGSSTALFMGLIGIVQRDIKRVIAYSTLSQLGYMMAAQGVAAYSLGMFHLMTHASFKALLFLSAGSVMVALHHEQDMQKMGGLARKMPVTYVCMLVGALALSAMPPFSGFFSKDLIIEAIRDSHIPGHQLAYIFVVLGTFVTALYTFRMFFLVFHGKPRMSAEHFLEVRESPLTILIPLGLLAIPSVISGYYFFNPALHEFFGHSIQAMPGNNPAETLALSYAGPFSFIQSACLSLPFWLGFLGIGAAFFAYVLKPELPVKFAKYFGFLHRILLQKYGIDALYDAVFGRAIMRLGRVLWKVIDEALIDKVLVQGSGLAVRIFASLLRSIQSGYLTHYVFFMMIGILVMLVQGK